MTDERKAFEAWAAARGWPHSWTTSDGVRQHYGPSWDVWSAALSAQPEPAVPTLTTCNCRWDGETQVQQCTLHEAHVQAIHEWAERAKAAEAKAAPTVACITECEACLTPDACRLRGKCDHYAAEQLRVSKPAAPRTMIEDVIVGLANEAIKTPDASIGELLGALGYVRAAPTEPAPGWCKHCQQYTIDEPLQAAPTVVEPEPVGWLAAPYGGFKSNPLCRMTFPPAALSWKIPLYVHPPQAPTVVEPVAWLHRHTGNLSRNESQRSEKDLRAYGWTPLFAHPPRTALNLMPVIQWLENGCDPLEAAKELRIYQAGITEGKP